MKLVAVALVALLNATSVTSTAGWADLRSPTLIAANQGNVATAQRLSSFPSTFAPCAAGATTVKEAAYNCLRDWQPAMTKYPGKVVYHYDPNLPAEKISQIREATNFALTRTAGFIDFMGFAPEFHMFVHTDSEQKCLERFRSWKGTRRLTWIFDTRRGFCSGDGGNGVGSAIPGTTSAQQKIYSEAGNGWEFSIYNIMPHEILSSFFGVAAEKRLGSQAVSLEVGQMWVFYLGSRAAWQASGIQLEGDTLEEYHQGLLPAPRAATWQPTLRDPRFCPQGSSMRATRCGSFDWSGLMAEHPWNYAVMDLGSQYVTAMFGPEWVQRKLWPAMVKEYARSNRAYPIYQARGKFRAEMNRVAKQLWGGQWSDLEDAIDQYVVSESKAAGVTGLD
jgi:hypothetical protein